MMVVEKLFPKGLFRVGRIIVISTILSLVAATNIYATPNNNRLAGLTRYETAVAIAKDGWQQSDYAIIAYGENYPDALAAAPLAKKYDAPIFLTQQNSLSNETKQALIDLKVKHVFIVGGIGAVTATVEKDLESIVSTVKRLAGNDRYETAIEIAKELGEINSISVTTGDDYADALSIGAVAGKLGMPIILVPKDYLPDSVKTYVSSHQIQASYIVGTQESISDSILSQLPNSERITGRDKYERNIAVLNKFGINFSNGSVCMATGNNFADALTGTAYASKKSLPIILLSDNINATTLKYIENNKDTLDTITIFGGEGVIPNTLVISYLNQGLLKPEKFTRNLEGIGTINSYKLAENATVEINYNIEAMQIMAATGSGFNHKGYLGGNYKTDLDEKIMDYFRAYVTDPTAKEFYEIESKYSTSGISEKIPISITNGMLVTEELGKDEFKINIGSRYEHPLFRDGNLYLKDMTGMVRNFVVSTKAEEFFKNNLELYNSTIDSFINETLNFSHIERLKDFYGLDIDNNQFRVILTVTENGGTGPSIQKPDGSWVFFNIMNPAGDKYMQLHLLYHETSHNFNSILRNNNREVLAGNDDYADLLGYNVTSDPFEHRLDETMARIVAATMLEQYHDKEMAERYISNELQRGWKNLDKLYNLTKERYLPNRDQYRNFSEFLPVMVEYIKGLQ